MSRILFGISGSIAGFKSAQTVSQMVQRGHEVQVVATPSALKFVGSATWEGLTGRPVLSDVFAEGHQMDHIHLARWADVFVLAPASANSIANWANGNAADLPSTLFLAFERHKPMFIAPAMNKEMWFHPAVQKNLARLKEWNVRVIEPEEGSLACGEIGAGRLASPEKIVGALEAVAAKPNRGKILVTSGATREPIDSVRFITNVSTGRTGADLADHFAEAGFRVTYLHGLSAILPRHPGIERQVYSDFVSLRESLRRLLKENSYSAIVHAAAVSDFSVGEISAEKVGGKIGSDQDIAIRLHQNPKLIQNLREWARPANPFVTAFKLTDTDSEKEQTDAVDKLLSRPEIDAVVWNNLEDVSGEKHLGKVYSKSTPPFDFSNHSELGEWILKLIGDGNGIDN